MRRRTSPIEVRPRFRVIRDGEVLIGPGKADLLEAIDRTGSIRRAAAELGMSYMRAWTLVRAMNDGFASALVESSRGGAGRGGASLTKTGHTVLGLYRRMQQESLDATAAAARELESLLE